VGPAFSIRYLSGAPEWRRLTSPVRPLPLVRPFRHAEPLLSNLKFQIQIGLASAMLAALPTAARCQDKDARGKFGGGSWEGRANEVS